MELDGYNEELSLAFEYQGRQHYEFDSFFHKDIEDFDRWVMYDKLKREMCVKNGVTLIEVPYTVKYDQMPDFIIKQLKENDINLLNTADQLNFKELINEAYVNNPDENKGEN